MSRSLLGSLIADYYTRHGTGGQLHVILDDFNIEDRFIVAAIGDKEFECDEEDCVAWCDAEAVVIAGMLLDIGEDKREQLIKEATDGNP